MALGHFGSRIDGREDNGVCSGYPGHEPFELFHRVCPYRRGAHIASRCQSNRQLGHRIAVRHFEHENDVVLTPRHIAADEPTAQSRDLALEGLVSSWYAFDRFRALVGPIQKADEEHGSPPFQFTNGVAKTTRSLLMRRTTQH